MEHFFQGNAYALCCRYSDSFNKINKLTSDDLESIRKLMSFRPYVESLNDCKSIIAILTEDEYLRKQLPDLLRQCHDHFMLLRIFLEFLTVLVEDLPKSPLGKYRRELYALCLSKNLIEQEEFKECWQMLSFMSKDEFVSKISKAIKVTQAFIETDIKHLELGKECTEIVNQKLQDVKELITKVVMAGMEITKTAGNNKETNPEAGQLTQLNSRQELKEHLMKMSKTEKPTSEFTKSVAETLEYIQNEIVAKYMVSLQKAPPLHELFVFSDLSTVRRNIIGAPRAALHMALNNPHYYLQCKCCQLREENQLLGTLPDLSVVYKLHLECGRMINLFDWLQAFKSVVDINNDDNDDDQQEQVDPQIQ